MLPILTRADVPTKAPRALALSSTTATTGPNGKMIDTTMGTLESSSSSSRYSDPSSYSMDRRQFRLRLDQSLGRKHFELHPTSIARTIPLVPSVPRSYRISASRSPRSSTSHRDSIASSSFAPDDSPVATPDDWIDIYGSSPQCTHGGEFGTSGENRGRGMIRKTSTHRGREPDRTKGDVAAAAAEHWNPSNTIPTTVPPIPVTCVSPTRLPHRSSPTWDLSTGSPHLSSHSMLRWTWGQNPFVSPTTRASHFLPEEEDMFAMDLEEKVEDHYDSLKWNQTRNGSPTSSGKSMLQSTIAPSHRSHRTLESEWVDHTSHRNCHRGDGRGRSTQLKSLPNLLDQEVALPSKFTRRQTDWM